MSENSSTHSQVTFDDAVSLHQSGDLQRAYDAYSSIVSIEPNHADAWHGLGVVALQTENFDHAVEWISKATSLNPSHFGFFINLGTAYQSLGRFESALEAYERSIELRSDISDVYYNRGVVLQKLGRFEEAIESYDKSISLSPDEFGVWLNRGVAYYELKKPKESCESFAKALYYRNDSAEAHRYMGEALLLLKNLDGSLASFDKSIACKKDFAEAYCGRGVVLNELKRHEEAQTSLEKSIELQPDLALSHACLGEAFRGQNLPEKALASFDRAIAIKPDFALAWLNRGMALDEMGDSSGATKCFLRSVDIDPKLAQGHHNIGFGKMLRGDNTGAIESYRLSLASDPDRYSTHSSLLYSLSSSPEVGPEDLYAEAVRFGEKFEGPLRSSWIAHNNSKDLQRRLNVGFVSGDFRNHAVASFIEPVLQELSKSPNFTLHAYYNNILKDGVTERLKGYFHYWHDVVSPSDEKLAEIIRKDSIDILIDLSGHTDKHRLCAFAYKPSPIQISWIGYMGTSGLSSMDYFLTDNYFLPEEKFGWQFTEKLVYLPSAVCFMPFKDSPSVNSLPALKNGYITFGSFNRRNKINAEVISLWSQVLIECIGSRMMLGGIDRNEFEDLTDLLEANGISKERFIFAPKADMSTYMKFHNEVDCCLDTFPYTGLTTTLHALWMGVPTLSLSGNTPFSRQGSNVNGHVGLSEWVTDDKQEFVKFASNLNGNLEELSKIRCDLRNRLMATPLGNAKMHVAGLELELRRMWQEWCTT